MKLIFKIFNSFTLVVGFIGVLIGILMWLKYQSHTEELRYLVFFFYPACTAFIALLFNKLYLMAFAVLISIPIIGVKSFEYDPYISLHPFYFYVIAFLFMVITHIHANRPRVRG